MTAPGIPSPAIDMDKSLLWRRLSYFIGVPLMVAVYAGLNNWQMQQIAGLPATTLFYLAHSLLPWWTTCSATWLSMKALSRFKPPWVALLLLGHLIGCLIVLPYSNWLTGIFEQRWPELDIGPEFGPLLSAAFWWYLLRAGIIWVAVNFVFDRFFGLPLYRYEIPRGYDKIADERPQATANAPVTPATAQAQQNGWGQQPPAFTERLPARLQARDVLAIKAEQHYIRVYAPAREYMVLYRFSDAVRELDAGMGTQVHRSYWVNNSAVESVHTRAKNFHLRLTNGATIPVSIPYQGMIRELARNNHWPIRG